MKKSCGGFKLEYIFEKVDSPIIQHKAAKYATDFTWNIL